MTCPLEAHDGDWQLLCLLLGRVSLLLPPERSTILESRRVSYNVSFRKKTRRLATANRSRLSIRDRRCKKFSSRAVLSPSKVGCCFSYSVRACIGGPNFCVCGGGGAWDPLPWDAGVPAPTRYCPKCVIIPNSKFCRSRSNCFGVIVEIRQKIVTPRVQPFKVTQGRWNRHWSIGWLWLPINVP